MSIASQPQMSRTNRRSAIRHPLRSDIRIECRKGTMGLGANLTESPIDVSQTGVCLAVRKPMKKGDEAEVLFTGTGRAIIKRCAEVAWVLERAADLHMVGLRFRPELSYAEIQQITRP